MRSLPVGAIVAAIVMFVLGFIFFGLLFPMALSPLAPEAAQAVQAALGTHLPASGNYAVPMDENAWMAGPSALITFAAAGQVPTMAMAMVLGFIHMAVCIFIFGLALKAVGGDFARQAKVVLLVGIATSAFMHLGDPIWYGSGWKMSLFVFLADGVMLIAGGLVLAKWFTSERAGGAPAAY
ncbi:MAG TPA: hypothetical protein VGW40_04330 [Allosphingosinicella sp.]|nr:hypothetical protein [Allosphingosinicella sp.]